MIKRLLKRNRLIRNIAVNRKLKEISPVMLYHSVENTVKLDHELLQGTLHNVTPEAFGKQLEQLKKRFQFVFIDEYYDRLAKNQSVDGLISLTFDDGYLSNLTEALPIMDALEIPGTLFLCTSLVSSGSFWRDRVRLLEGKNLLNEFLIFASKEDSDFSRFEPEKFYSQSKDPLGMNSKRVDEMICQFLDYKQIKFQNLGNDIYCKSSDLKKIDSKYFNIGNHTMNHYVLSTLSSDEQIVELSGAHDYISSLGLPQSMVFSIPFGGRNTINEDTRSALRNLNYTGYIYSEGYRLVDSRIDEKQEGLVVATRTMPKEIDKY